MKKSNLYFVLLFILSIGYGFILSSIFGVFTLKFFGLLLLHISSVFLVICWLQELRKEEKE